MPLTLIPFLPDHIPMLSDWLRASHVSFRRRPPEEDLALAAQLPAAYGHAIIEWNCHPIGYLRWQRLSRAILDVLHLSDLPANSLDVDVLIGPPAAIGFGFGGRALRLLADQMRSRGDAPMMGMAVSVRNRPALEAARKAGFRAHRRYDPPGYEPSHLMVMDLQTTA